MAMRRGAFARYFGALADGDPIAIGITLAFIAFLVFIGIIALRAKADERRDEERKRKKWGLKDPPKKQ
jgi:hypothetical protein